MRKRKFNLLDIAFLVYISLKQFRKLFNYLFSFPCNKYYSTFKASSVPKIVGS